MKKRRTAPEPGPIRTCVVCRRRQEKSRLLRWVVDAGRAMPDPRGRLPGRGHYVCRTAACVDGLARRGKRWGIDFAESEPGFRLAIGGEVPQNVAGEKR